MTLYLKALRCGRRGTYTDFVWPPPGEVVRVKGPLRPCEHGLRVCRPDQILGWLSDDLWLAEASDRFTHIDHGDKTVVREAGLVRQLTAWDERSARLFAADCAEHVLPIFEAAGAAAGAAERAWQTGHLLDMLDLTDDERARLGVAS